MVTFNYKYGFYIENKLNPHVTTTLERYQVFYSACKKKYVVFVL